MSYYLSQVGTYDLTKIRRPRLTVRRQMSAPAAATLAGAYDLAQGVAAPVGITSYILRGDLLGSSASDLESEINTLAALHNTKQTLYRMESSDDTTTNTTSARVQIEWPDMTVEHHRHIPVTCTFTLLGRGLWNGTSRTTNETLDTSPKTVTLSNNGSVWYYYPVITVTNSNTDPLTSLTIRVTGQAYELTYSGSVAINDVLVIDCGALTVLNDGSGDIANLARGSNDANAEWLPIPNGSASYTVTRTGGTNATISVAYYDAYQS